MASDENDKAGVWYPFKDGEHWRIRRMRTDANGDRRAERLQRATYAHVANTYEAMLAHCDRLNYGVNMKRQREIEIESAFIPKAILDGFYTELQASIPEPGRAKFLYKTVFEAYTLDVFVNGMKLPNPADWPKHQTVWGQALSNPNAKHAVFDRKVSRRTLVLVIQTANRFLKYLHQQMPDLYPSLKLTPISKAVLNMINAESDSDDKGMFIKDEDWATILKKAPRDISPFLELMYYYGLRRAESLGFDSTGFIKNAYLRIEQQIVSMTGGAKFGPLKNRDKRNTPHWFCTPLRAHQLITLTLSNKMHPDTLSEKWESLMSDLGFEYKLHDFRRTFITRSLRGRDPRDVQLAVGHTDLRTTMKYAQDDRDLSDETFDPKAG
jgi:hypothetical protein